MVLFDAVAEFVSFLELALIILAVKEAWGVIKGGGGSGGGWGGKMFGGGGDRASIAGENAAEAMDKAALADEQRLAQQEAAQKSEEIREAQDSSAILNLNGRQVNDLSHMIGLLNQIIQVLKKGTVRDPNLRQEIGEKIGQLTTQWVDLEKVKQNIAQYNRDLANEEVLEESRLRNMAITAKDSMMREQKSQGNRVKGQFVKMNPFLKKEASSVKKWDAKQSGVIKKALGESMKERDLIMRQFTVHEREVSELEREFTQEYTTAINYLKTSGTASIPLAIQHLELARKKLESARNIENKMVRNDINKIRSRIQSKFNDLKVENVLRQEIGMGIRQQVTTGSRAKQTVASGLKKGLNLGPSFVGKIKGRFIKP